MRAALLLIFYLLLLVIQFVLLRRAWSRRGKWRVLYILQVLCLLLATALTRIFDALPGYGMMPGLTYFAETMYSFLFMAVFAVMLLAGLVLGLIRRGK